MFRKYCLVCGSQNIDKIIELGMHAFADTFIPESKLSESEPVYPLACQLCLDCGQIQNYCEVNPEDRYSLYDYSYTSSNSYFARNHWEQYASEVSTKVNLSENSFVVEIGSNDGFLSEQFLKKGNKVLGVDPSQYMANLARERGINTIIDLFNKTTAKKIIQEHGKADLIIANNVFNHSNNPLDFAKGVYELLEEGGTFVFELPYWFFLVKTQRFDQIYHEHVSYFTVKSSKELLERVGLKILNIEIVDYHGGSLRIYAKKDQDLIQESKKVEQMIQKEIINGIFRKNTYEDFMQNIKKQRAEFLNQIHEIKLKGHLIIGVGAAAKANTFLNFYKLDNTILDYITDSSQHKQGKHTPLTRIPICSDEVFSKYEEPYALILSWNISDKLKEILYKINPRIKFLELPRNITSRKRNIWKNVPEPLELHKDERGEIVDVFYKETIEHVAVISSKKGNLRGDHYHKQTTQHCLITKGTLEYWYKHVNSNKPVECIILREGDTITTPPNEIHALGIIEDNEFIVFTKGLRGGKDYESDTFKIQPSIIPKKDRQRILQLKN